MATKPTAPRVMSGTFGMLYWNGEPVYEVKKFEAKLKVDREDISFAGEMGKDSKLIGMGGEWSFTVNKVFSRGAKAISLEIKEGRDPRCQFNGKVDDPDAFGSERMTLYNCWFGDLDLMNFESGKVINQEFSGGFTDFDFPDTVEVR